MHVELSARSNQQISKTHFTLKAAACCCRSQVSEKYRKKIELMVRKPDRAEEPQERLAPCPFCGLPGPEGELQCISCQNTIPFDIATGAALTLMH
jgi:hypothetical protein